MARYSVLFHRLCLIAFRNGRINFCPWCVIYCSVVQAQVSVGKVFENHIRPNIQYKPIAHFSVKLIQNNSTSYDHYCLLTASPSNHHKVYYLLKYNDFIEPKNFHVQSSEQVPVFFNVESINIASFRSLFGTRYGRLRLMDKKVTIKYTNPLVYIPRGSIQNNTVEYLNRTCRKNKLN